MERYNKTIKTELGEKRTCNLIVFLNHINNMLKKLIIFLSKMEMIIRKRKQLYI